MKMTVFWDVAPCRPAESDDVPDVLTASIIRAYHPDNRGSDNL
jgi:hypothetical protein